MHAEMASQAGVRIPWITQHLSNFVDRKSEGRVHFRFIVKNWVSGA